MYCKYYRYKYKDTCENSINSSKVYCKYLYCLYQILQYIVLIVAKCIVNMYHVITGRIEAYSINSSKVYCKCASSLVGIRYIIVLIVAKCIVNKKIPFEDNKKSKY